ncbi:MAG: S1 RNA-binding domain-containing protein [Chroococcales cyanobacterium]
MNSESTRSPESNVSFSMDDFAKALDEHDRIFQRGQVVRGKVFQHDGNGAYIDLGEAKSTGFVPASEVLIPSGNEISDVLPLEQEFDFLVLREEDTEGRVTLSQRQLAVKKTWDELLEKQENGKSVQIYISGLNKGGVTGEVNGLRAFIPRSHLIEKEDLDSLMGQTLTGKLLEVDPERRKLVLSQREAAKAAAVRRVEPNSITEGKVVNIKPYGVFVDIDGATGLLHIKQVSGKHIESLERVFPIGKEIKVVVLEVDEWSNRISLSTRVLESHPGEILENLEEMMATAEERFAKFQAEKQE